MTAKKQPRSKTNTTGGAPRNHEPVLDAKSVEKGSDRLTEMIDLTGLVYPAMAHPVILIGLPKPYVDEFFSSFSKPRSDRSVVKKATGNRHYVRLSRAVDVYRVCLAMSGKTKIHQKAVKEIMKKLEAKYGKEILEKMI